MPANSMLLSQNILNLTDLILMSKPFKKQFCHAFLHYLSCSTLNLTFHSPHAYSDSSSQLLFLYLVLPHSLLHCLILPWANLLSVTSCLFTTNQISLLRQLPPSLSWHTYSKQFLPQSFSVSHVF